MWKEERFSCHRSKFVSFKVFEVIRLISCLGFFWKIKLGYLE